VERLISEINEIMHLDHFGVELGSSLNRVLRFRLETAKG